MPGRTVVVIRGTAVFTRGHGPGRSWGLDLSRAPTRAPTEHNPKTACWWRRHEANFTKLHSRAPHVYLRGREHQGARWLHCAPHIVVGQHRAHGNKWDRLDESLFRESQLRHVVAERGFSRLQKNPKGAQGTAACGRRVTAFTWRSRRWIEAPGKGEQNERGG